MYINLLTLHRWTSIFRNYLKAFLTGSDPFYSGFATIFVSFNCQKWNHALYILFFVGIGTNSNFNCIPNPCASFFTILRLGFLVPFSIRLISACVIPVSLIDESHKVYAPLRSAQSQGPLDLVSPFPSTIAATP